MQDIGILTSGPNSYYYFSAFSVTGDSTGCSNSFTYFAYLKSGSAHP